MSEGGSVKQWIQANKLATFLMVVVIAFLFWIGNFSSMQGDMSMRSVSMSQSMPMGRGGMAAPMAPAGEQAVMMERGMMQDSYAPSNEKSRMVVQTSSLSLVVSDVEAAAKMMREYASSIGGYMVDSQVSRPEEGGTGSLELRIPSAQLDAALSHLKSLSVKVVSENLVGSDVTDQFVDNEARLEILEKNKARFEEIMAQASDVEEILSVQQQIFSLQSQIDSIKGQQLYLQKTSEMALVHIYLSTDEFSLPYAPAESWRPEVIAKHAVRSLVGAAQGLGTLLIWVAVYSVVWVPVASVAWWWKRGK